MKKFSLFATIALVIFISGCGFVEKTQQETSEAINRTQYKTFFGEDGDIVSGAILTGATKIYLYNDDISIFVKTGVNKNGFFLKNRRILQDRPKDRPCSTCGGI